MKEETTNSTLTHSSAVKWRRKKKRISSFVWKWYQRYVDQCEIIVFFSGFPHLRSESNQIYSDLGLQIDKLTLIAINDVWEDSWNDYLC